MARLSDPARQPPPGTGRPPEALRVVGPPCPSNPAADDAQRLLRLLDVAQRACVVDPAAVVVVEAGPGAGKTRVLTHRVAYRAATGSLEPARTAVVTFTRRAAAELGERLWRLQVQGVWCGTVHGLARRILVDWAEHRDRHGPAFSSDPLGLLAEAAGPHTRSLTELAAEAEWLASQGLPPAAYPAAAKAAGRRPPVPVPETAAILERYETLKRRRGVLDPADLPRAAREALEDPPFGAAMRWRHRHLFVDEAQDLTPAQWSFLLSLAGEDPDVFLVGDPDQTIYRFNGADPGFLLATERWLPGPSRHRLRTNHRSARQLVELTEQLRWDLGLPSAVADRPPGEARADRAVLSRGGRDLPAAIEVAGFPDASAEALAVARQLRRLRAAGWGWSTMAVLARTRSRLALVEHRLAAAGIPLRVARRLLEEPVVRDTLHRLDLRRPRPAATVLADLEEQLAVRAEAESGSGLLTSLVELVGEWVRQVGPKGDSRDLVGWLRTELRGPDRALIGEQSAGVELATFHRAKGTEFAHVVLVGLEDGTVPLGHAQDLEEEQRLFYVACTRAERSLLCTWAVQPPPNAAGAAGVDRGPSPWLAPVSALAERLGEQARTPNDRTLAKTRIDQLRRTLAASGTGT